MRDAVSGRLEGIWSGRMLLDPGSVVDDSSEVDALPECPHRGTLRCPLASQRSSSFFLPWPHFSCPGRALGTTGAISGGAVLSLPALFLSRKIPLNTNLCPGQPNNPLSLIKPLCLLRPMSSCGCAGFSAFLDTVFRKL